MSVTRKTEDAGVVPATAGAWPRRSLEGTPTLGLTPTLPDEEVVHLAAAARKAALRAFGPAECAREAEIPPSV